MAFRKSTKIYPIGTKFGWIEIVGEPIVEKKGNTQNIKEYCRCNICGKEWYVIRRSLVHGFTKSCGSVGCKKVITGDKHKERQTKHGMCKTRFYNIYYGAKSRCENKTNNVYYLYGGKGIKFERKTFEDFMNDMYESYVDHVNKYGEKDTTIERIDSDKNYCKENCKRATCKEQSNNISKNRKVEYNGKVYNSVSLMCDDLGLRYELINCRLNRGWTVKEAVETKELKIRLHDKNCKPIFYKGKQYYSMMQLSREIGINYKMLSRRLNAGWDVVSAIETPLKFIEKGE